MNSASLIELVERLPEIYQPLYGHPELSDNPSRSCDDRLIHIGALHDAMREKLGRPVRVLDLGCAQGYISLNLADRGADVLGIDYLEANVDVCRQLAMEHPALLARFEHGQIEHCIETLESDQFDLVLGLSVFHHICHLLGVETTTRLLTNLAALTAVSVFELALAGEPLYWAKSLPSDERTLLAGFAFVHELAYFPTHLSQLSRPLYVASSRYWYLGGQLNAFDSGMGDSHALAQGTHRGSRRYLFSGDKLAKVVRLDGERGQYNRAELVREVAAMQRVPDPLAVLWPKMHAYDIAEREGWIVRDLIVGDLLLDVIMKGGQYDASRVLRDVLTQLVALEQSGQFHNDVRVWNVVLKDDGGAVLVDYGAIGSDPADCVWPVDIFLAFFIFAHDVIYHEVSPLKPTLAPYISPYSLPEPYASWIASLWNKPREHWSFAALLAKFPDASAVFATKTTLDGLATWIAAMQSQAGALCGYITQQDLAINDHGMQISALAGIVDSLGQLSAAAGASQSQLEQRHEALDAALVGLNERHDRAIDHLTGAWGQLVERHEALDKAVLALEHRHGEAIGSVREELRRIEQRDAQSTRESARALEALTSQLHVLVDRHEALDGAVIGIEHRHGEAMGLIREDLRQFEERHAQSKADSEQALEALASRVLTGEQALSPVLQRFDVAEDRATKAAEKIEFLHDVSVRAATEVSTLQRTLDDALRDLGRARQHLMASEAQRQSVQQQIEMIYASRSFRLTRPFRDVFRTVRSGLPLISRILRPGWHHLVRHRWGRRLGVVLFYPFPRLRARVYSSIAAHATIEALSGDALNRPALSPSAEDIHQRLQKKISKKSG